MTEMMADLFDDASSCYPIDLADADIRYYPCFIEASEADRLLDVLIKEVQWQQESLVVYGKTHRVPRLSAWYADDGKSYEYSGLKKSGLAWLPVLQQLKQKIQQATNSTFNSVLANLYRDQKDGVGWHSDDEPELGCQPVIASLSLGQSRIFQLKHKQDKSLKQSIELAHGSLLIMQGNTQHCWQHQIPKSKQAMSERINLTFRNVA